MDAQPAARLAWVQNVTARARRERRLSGPPLLAAAALVGGFAPIAAWAPIAAAGVYWLVGGPLVFWALRRWYDRHAADQGFDSDGPPFAQSGIGLGVLLLWGPLNLLLPLTALGVGLGVVAVRQANRFLLGCAVALVVVGAIGADFFENRLFDLTGYVSWAPVVVYGVFAAALAAVGVTATFGERR